jgi:hypothetical protein
VIALKLALQARLKISFEGAHPEKPNDYICNKRDHVVGFLATVDHGASRGSKKEGLHCGN